AHGGRAGETEDRSQVVQLLVRGPCRARPVLEALIRLGEERTAIGWAREEVNGHADDVHAIETEPPDLTGRPHEHAPTDGTRQRKNDRDERLRGPPPR